MKFNFLSFYFKVQIKGVLLLKLCISINLISYIPNIYYDTNNNRVQYQRRHFNVLCKNLELNGILVFVVPLIYVCR